SSRTAACRSQGLLGSAAVTLRDHRYCDDLVPCARGAPSAEENDREQCSLIGSAESHTVQALGPRNAAQELAARREDIDRLPGRDVPTSLGVDRGAVARAPALQACELALIRQRSVGL